MSEFEQIKTLLQSVSEKQEQLLQRQTSTEKKIDALHDTVIGNEVYGHVGLVKEVRNIQKYVEDDKKMKSRISGGLVVIGVVWTLILEVWKTVIK